MSPSVETHLWSSESAVLATGGHCPPGSPEDWRADGVTIDSRDVQIGDLFIAIKGPSFDGHDFAADALAAGAVCAVVDHKPETLPAGAPLLEVVDTMMALEDLGRAARSRTDARIIAVTGSVGKTGTKEALRFVLEDQAPCVASRGSFNNHWGVPLSLSRMPADTAYGVFEIGMNHPGEITPLVDMVRPHVAVITNVESVHSAYFDSIEAIADAKAEIFSGLSEDGIAVLNRDNALFARLNAAAQAAGVKTVIGFGEHAEAQARAFDIRTDAEGSDVEAVICGKDIRYRLAQPGRHWVLNSLAVLAAVDAAGGDVPAAAAELAGLGGLKGRGRRHTVNVSGGSFTVIDESYNASPASMRATLQVLGQSQPTGQGRRIAVLGDMLELGEQSAEHHAALADILIAEKIDLVFAAGPFMEALWKALPKPLHGGYAATSQEVMALVVDAVRPGDVLVVKGSAGSRIGPIVEALIACKDRG
ncbi:MAG: UDP-N-acetylmuramoylalanyl-D-glutamyl-2,6-diaminopimelate--D-alanyl-D-alanine ligase [Rhodospirillales bacterium]|nr:UDP-N-acetylmuramoylalanyl-D-glutamyl-2,6-diaminopimelate--D-alanyl-D-alanine ligase [Alphaproteobacteria bacterium]MBL6947294.1 UDP-N-acetylmuramoylalanyl-D-glutamyl-2,6-diaminopimelate--D-alanyl-D-alanine ligase [Rhodospirillales bacterium]